MPTACLITEYCSDVSAAGLSGVDFWRSFNLSVAASEGKTIYGCPKSHCAKVRAYCSACVHLICKFFSGMFQKSSSFEEFNGFSEIDVHFFQ